MGVQQGSTQRTAGPHQDRPGLQCTSSLFLVWRAAQYQMGSLKRSAQSDWAESNFAALSDVNRHETCSRIFLV